MDKFLADIMKESTPKLNHLLAAGLATAQMRTSARTENKRLVEQYIDGVIRSAAKGLPPELTYVGYARCTEEEEHAEVSRQRLQKARAHATNTNNAKRTFETSRSDFYLIKLLFRLNGQDLKPRYLYLPFIGDANSIVINGSRWVISPVLADKVISIGEENIFVRLLRDRWNFQRVQVSYQATTTTLTNGYESNSKTELVRIVHGHVHHNAAKKQKIKPSVRAHTCMAHYLFCKYGFTEVFKRFTGCVPLVANDFDPEQYPGEEWIICSSNRRPGVAPRDMGRAASYDYMPPQVKIAVKHSDYTPMVKSLIAGFFYVADHFPHQITTEYVDVQRQWMLVLGQLLMTAGTGAGKLYDGMANHFASLDEYLDQIVQKQMEEIDINVSDIYEFFAVLIENLNDWLLPVTDNERINSMYGKELVILYFVLHDITTAVFNFIFRIRSLAKKGLKAKEVESILAKTLRMKLIHQLTKTHGEATGVSYSGDNMAFKVTSILIPQSKSKRQQGHGSDRGSIGDPSKSMHISVPEVGSYTSMTKSDPSGRERLNQSAHVDHKGTIQQNQKFVAELAVVQRMLGDTVDAVDQADDSEE